MRVVKDAEERKNEILDVAERLFAAKGFDNTSTTDILEEVGIARGTLYYHFKSKEDILDAMIGRMTDRLMTEAAKISARRELPAFQRLPLTIMALNVDSELGCEVLEQVHRPQNALMHQKMRERLLAGVNPLITGLVEEAMAEGVCQTDYPAEVVEMIMLYSNTVFDDLMEYSEQERRRKVDGFIYNVERLLGMERGSLQETVMPIFEKQKED